MVAALCSGCAQTRPEGGPLPQFTGEYRIVDAGEEASPELLPEFVPLSRLSGLSNRVRQSLASSLGTVHVRPAIGGEYAEWNMAFDDPPHEIRRMVGPKKADGSFPIWRFEQQPAPRVDPRGVVRLERNEIVADFVSALPAARALMIRERWTLVGDDTLKFALEAGPQSGKLVRVGGFTAIRQ
jgi:hypothetical protein